MPDDIIARLIGPIHSRAVFGGTHRERFEMLSEPERILAQRRTSARESGSQAKFGGTIVGQFQPARTESAQWLEIVIRPPFEALGQRTFSGSKRGENGD